MIEHTLELALLIDAAWVFYGLGRRKNMWLWICLYWVLLTLKNGVSCLVH